MLGVSTTWIAALLSVGGLAAQAPDEPGEALVPRVESTARFLEAVRIQEAEPDLDGVLDDPAWLSAPVATDFVQLEPHEGLASTERTEARVLYGEDALYVAFRAFDSRPDSIVGQLTRRDQDSYSDRVRVMVDSYHDRRTAFQFSVNPVGVKLDRYRFDDTGEDLAWDAVWDVATRVDDGGWTAEFRIPYSQLRFGNEADQTWGINFAREIARRREMALWSPFSGEDAAIVSKAGELRGLRNLGTPRRLEVQPYTMGRLRRGPGDAGDPFFEKNDVRSTVGADLKFGVTNDLTLDVTINPDFGQVEADPAQVNLSAFETFFPEKRPFFIEGAGIFNFRIGLGDEQEGNEFLFYSRRIGRAPQGRVDPEGGFVDRPAQTTILGAWKLSGKTQRGWSVGLIHAVTQEESVDVVTGAGHGLRSPVEPFSNYGVVRVQKDFREGRSAVDFIGTVTNRKKDIADELGLRSGAYTGGIDARHRFGAERFEVSGYLLGSHISGTESVIESAQRSSARYYQRPDADHLEVDPTWTSLGGWSGFASIGKIGGGFWRFSTGLQARSPGFETNDLGFMQSTGHHSQWLWTGYNHYLPQGPFRQYNVNVLGWQSHSSGGERTGTGFNINAWGELDSPGTAIPDSTTRGQPSIPDCYEADRPSARKPRGRDGTASDLIPARR